jgi:hypothetical protein
MTDGLVGGYQRFGETYHSENGSDTFLRNIGNHYKTSCCHNPGDHYRKRENIFTQEKITGQKQIHIEELY